MKKISKLIIPTFVLLGSTCGLAPIVTSCGQTVYYTVHFETNGAKQQIADVKVEKGKLLTEPTKPVKEGYAFFGWYKDTKFTQKFNFSKDVVTSDLVLYAQWEAIGTEVTETEWDTAFNYLTSDQTAIWKSLDDDYIERINALSVESAEEHSNMKYSNFACKNGLTSYKEKFTQSTIEGSQTAKVVGIKKNNFTFRYSDIYNDVLEKSEFESSLGNKSYLEEIFRNVFYDYVSYGEFTYADGSYSFTNGGIYETTTWQLESYITFNSNKKISAVAAYLYEATPNKTYEQIIDTKITVINLHPQYNEATPEVSEELQARASRHTIDMTNETSKTIDIPKEEKGNEGVVVHAAPKIALKTIKVNTTTGEKSHIPYINWIFKNNKILKDQKDFRYDSSTGILALTEAASSTDTFDFDVQQMEDYEKLTITLSA